jgi:hypothetical protein
MRRLWSLAKAGVVGLTLLVTGVAATAAPAAPADKQAGLEQWRQIESVLSSPRCLNCHGRSDYPRQGDDRHVHNFLVQRGVDGHGVGASKCAMCHHDLNSDASGVPGATGWRLAPLKMAWENKPGERMSSRDLCRLLTDPARNGNRKAADLIDHHASEPLVLWAWSPGVRRDGSARQPPPISHAAFVQATQEWAKAGTPCP